MNKGAARSALHLAIHAGKLKPEPCKHCGTEKVEAHHQDYDKPLDVLWLCKRCHTREHLRTAIYDPTPKEVAKLPKLSERSIQAYRRIIH